MSDLLLYRPALIVIFLLYGPSSVMIVYILKVVGAICYIDLFMLFFLMIKKRSVICDSIDNTDCSVDISLFGCYSDFPVFILIYALQMVCCFFFPLGIIPYLPGRLPQKYLHYLLTYLLT